MAVRLKKNKKGFTLIELIVVIAILGILAAIMIPRFGGFQDKANASQAVVEGKQIATAIDTFIAEGKTYTNVFAPSPTQFNRTQVLTLASIGTPVGEYVLMNVTTTGTFTFAILKGGKLHTASRTNNGSVTVSTTNVTTLPTDSAPEPTS